MTLWAHTSIEGRGTLAKDSPREPSASRDEGPFFRRWPPTDNERADRAVGIGDSPPHFESRW